MDHIKRDLLFLASRVLSYPTEEDRYELLGYLDEIKKDSSFEKKLNQALQEVLFTPIFELQETYVATFDLRVKLGLYLTAHEFGDSPKRGAAIIRLQKIINEAGYERVEGELADYLPMLYEFVALTNDDNKNERLVKRLACVTQRLVNELPKENPYFLFMSLFMDTVFTKPTKDEMEEMERNREEADLEELPYPIMYT